MNWYKRAQNVDALRDHLEKVLGLGKYAPTEDEKEKWRKKREERKNKYDCDCQHSLDTRCDGEDDGW